MNLLDQSPPKLPLVNALLGTAYGSPVIDKLVGTWEQLKWIDEEELTNAARDHRLSLMNRELGLYLFFTDDQGFRSRYGPPSDSGSLILSRVVYLFSLAPDFTAFAGSLPLGLVREDDYLSLALKLGPPVEAWRAGPQVCKARWLHEDTQIDVSFDQKASGLRLLSVMPRRTEDAHLTDQEQAQACALLPTPGEFVSLLGTPLSQLAQMVSLAPLRLSAHRDEIAEYGEADFTKSWGLELYFKPGQEIDRSIHPGAASNEPCLSGLRYRADLDFASRGFQGPLPMGLSFDDPPAVVVAKVGTAPWKSSFDERDGAQRWRFERADLHVLYSVLEDRIYRVTLLARGCYED
jgi:hypothetical protein